VRPLRVTFVAPFGLCRRGTTRARVIPLAAALAAGSLHVRVVIPNWDCPRPPQGPCRAGAAEIVYLGGRATLRQPLDARLLHQTYQTALAGNPDVVHCFKPIGYSGAVALLLGTLARRVGWRGRLAVDTDDLEGRAGWARRAGRPAWQTLALDWQERRALRAADLVTAASEELVRKAAVGRNGRAAPVYLPNGVTPPELICAPGQNRPARAPNLLLYTRFNEFAPARAAEIVGAILDRVPESRLVVVGDGPAGARSAFRHALEREGAANRTDWLGFLTGPALATVLEADSVALWLFDDNPINRARSPIKLLELLAHGRPVVAEAVGEVRALCGAGARLVAPGDASRLIECAVALLASPRERNYLGEQARAAMREGATWRRRATELARAYAAMYT